MKYNMGFRKFKRPVNKYIIEVIIGEIWPLIYNLTIKWKRTVKYRHFTFQSSEINSMLQIKVKTIIYLTITILLKLFLSEKTRADMLEL